MISRITISLRKNVSTGEGRDDDWIVNDNAEVTTFAFGMGGRSDAPRTLRRRGRGSAVDDVDEDESLEEDLCEIAVTGDVPLKRLDLGARTGV